MRVCSPALYTSHRPIHSHQATAPSLSLNLTHNSDLQTIWKILMCQKPNIPHSSTTAITLHSHLIIFSEMNAASSWSQP